VSGEAGNWLLWAALVGLGGWRLASLLVHEEGPFAVFARARNAVLPGPGEEYGFVAKVLDCIWCASIYTTSVLAALWFVHPAFVVVPAAWAVAIAIEGIVRR
jgi:hypothetical protein